MGSSGIDKKAFFAVTFVWAFAALTFGFAAFAQSGGPTADNSPPTGCTGCTEPPPPPVEYIPNDQTLIRAAISTNLNLPFGKADPIAVLVALKHARKPNTIGFTSLQQLQTATEFGYHLAAWGAKMKANVSFESAPPHVKAMVRAVRELGGALFNKNTTLLIPRVDNLRTTVVTYLSAFDNPKEALANENVRLLLSFSAWMSGLTGKQVAQAEEEVKRIGIAAVQ